MAEVISNVGNRYIFFKESTYGTTPGSPTQLDIGHVQSITLDEDEGQEVVNSMNSGHTGNQIEDGLYNLSGRIVTWATKSSMRNLLEALLGDLTVDAPTEGQYTIATDPVHSDDLSYGMKFNTQAGETMVVAGLCVTGGDVTLNRQGFVEFTLNFQAQIMTPATATLSPSTSTGSLFRGDLDSYVTYGGNNTILNSFNVTVDWNFNIDDSRGIEPAHANGRRVISRVIRNNLTLGGSFESQMDANIDSGYEDERSDVAIVMVLSRGTDNEHTFTIATSRTKTRSRELNNDNNSKLLSGDFDGLDIAVVGDY